MDNAKNKNIKVSIIVPVYNASKYLKDSIEDILNQSYEDFELICVNDGSTDNSLEVLSEYKTKDERVIVINQENKGGGSARNVGADFAKGEYLLFLDADDKFENCLIKKCIEKADKEKCDVLIYAADEFHYITKETKPSPWLLQKAYEKYDGNPFHYTTTTVWNKLYRREYLNKYNIRHQDQRVTAFSMYFTFFALMYTSRISFLDEILVHYRGENPSSSMRRHDSSPLDTLVVLEAIWNRLKSDVFLSNKKSIYINFAIKNIFERTGWFKEYDSFSIMYDELHNGGFDRIGLSEDNDVFVENKGWIEQKKNIMKYSMAEYFFNKEKENKKRGMLQQVVYYLPDKMEDFLSKRETNIIIYGAGQVGISYFRQIKRMKNISVVAWVDKDYKEKGFPITSPINIRNNLFNYIIIAVEHERFFDEIKCKLESLGIESNRILWEEPKKLI